MLDVQVNVPSPATIAVQRVIEPGLTENLTLTVSPL
jgi:hypothetical protein